MCGICGFTNATDCTEDAEILSSMCDAMAHRGPDGEGIFLEDGIALGHRRLSLIDLEGGAQPMMRDGHVIVFNGEIYNYQDLSVELAAEGWEFETTSDTEVLLVGYIAWGEQVLEKVRGMFAFAIWNMETKELFCARDFFGIKPFYYTQAGDTFIFASEIKCILEHPAYERKLNKNALEQYLCFQFSALEETFFEGVFKLPPAHCMKVDANGSIYMRRYWYPEFTPNVGEGRTLEQAADDIDATLRESVKYHNVADVEVGSFLSSGIDSSYMAACLGAENPDIKTFTVGFAEYSGDKDEITWAQELARELGLANTSHHITEEEFRSALPLVQWHMDEPSADPSAVALYFVDKLAAEQVKAVLSGEGADEFFGGYRIYQAPLAGQKLSWVPSSVLRGAASILRAAHIRGANYLDRASETVEDWYYTNANAVAFSVEDRARILKWQPTCETPQQLVASAYAEAREQNLDEPTRMQYVDLFYWLVGDILLKTDKMSMAHSLESRVPFLDKKVFEMAATLPTPQKVTDEETKVALREAAERAIPRDWARKEKLGFPVPVVAWLREDRWYDVVREWFEGPIAQEFFNIEELVKMLDEHRAGKDLSRKIWIVWMFLMWYDIYFVQQKRPI